MWGGEGGVKISIPAFDSSKQVEEWSKRLVAGHIGEEDANRGLEKVLLGFCA